MREKEIETESENENENERDREREREKETTTGRGGEKYIIVTTIKMRRMYRRFESSFMYLEMGLGLSLSYG